AAVARDLRSSPTRRASDLLTLLGASPGLVPDHVEHLIHLMILHADHDGGVATPKEAAGTGEAGRTEVGFQEGVDDRIGVLVLNDGNDQLHAFLSPLRRPVALRDYRPR